MDYYPRDNLLVKRGEPAIMRTMRYYIVFFVLAPLLSWSGTPIWGHELGDFHIHPRNPKLLILATNTGGFFEHDVARKNFTFYRQPESLELSPEFSPKILIDQEANIYWIILQNQLFKFHRLKRSWEPIELQLKKDESDTKNEKIINLALGKERVWILTSQRILYYDKNLLKVVSLSEKYQIPEAHFLSVSFDNNGDPWFCSEKGLGYLKASTTWLWTSFLSTSNVRTMYFAKKRAWVGYFQGISKLTPSGETWKEEAVTALGKATVIEQILEYGDSLFVISSGRLQGIAEKGAFYEYNLKSQELITHDIPDTRAFFKMHRDNKGIFWLAEGRVLNVASVYHYDPKNKKVLQKIEPKNWLEALLKNRDEKILKLTINALYDEKDYAFKLAKLLPFLNHKSESIRISTLKTLHHLPEDQRVKVIAVIKNHLATERSNKVVLASFDTLAFNPHEEGKLIIQQYTNDKDALIREKAAWALDYIDKRLRGIAE